jgi:hypothetical protein
MSIDESQAFPGGTGCELDINQWAGRLACEDSVCWNRSVRVGGFAVERRVQIKKEASR